jgi:6-pyruvoyltetrahydropterin/6-carboxytetrahydropterin synthase
MIQHNSIMILITRKASFSAAHRMNSPSLTQEQNTAIFGKCNSLHGHNYRIEVTVKGEINQITGMVLNINDVLSF